MNPAPRAAASDYGWRDAAPSHTHGYLAPRVLAILRALQVRRVLDLGCGNGALCGTLHAAGFDVAGVDNDLHGVELARVRHAGITFHRAGVQDDAAPLRTTEGRFEAVVSTEVIEHLYAPHLLPKFAAELLVPRGWLVVSTPYHGYWKNLALALAGKWDHHHTALWDGGHIKFWSRATLGQLLGDNGYDVTGFHGVGRLPGLWKSMVLVARHRGRNK